MLDLKPVDGGGITPRGNGRQCHGVVGCGFRLPFFSLAW